MTGHEWDMSGARLAAFQFAEWMVINDGSDRNFMDEYQKDPEQAWAAAEAHGWVETIPPNSTARRRLGEAPREPRPRLTGTGRLEVDRVRSLRTSRLARVGACRQAILLWLAEQGGSAASLALFLQSDPRFYDTPFTEEEAGTAAKYLVDKGLVKGWYYSDGMLMQPVLTARGTDCVEIYDGDVQRFFNPTQSGGSVTNNQQNNFYGGNAQAAQGSNVTQTQNNGIDAEGLSSIFQAMRDALSTVDDPQDRDDVEHGIKELEAAVEGGDPQTISASAGRLKRLGARIGTTALTVATSQGVEQLLTLLGLG